MRNVLLSFILLFSQASFAEASDNEKFKLAFLIPLSGMAAEFGTAIKNGASLAIEDNGGSLGHCEFIYEDTSYDAMKAVTAFHKLSSERVDLVYQFFGEDAVAPLAEAKKIPLLCDSVDPKVSIGREFIIRNQNSSYEFVEPIPEMLLKKEKSKIVVVKTESPYLNLMVDSLVRASGDRFQKFDVVTVQSGETDFKPYVPKILKGDYDAIGLFVFPGQLSSLGRLFKGREKRYLFFGADFLQTNNEIKYSGGVLEGSFFPNNVVSEEYYKRYVEKFGNDSQMKFAGEGYDVTKMILENICSRSMKPNNLETLGLIKSVKIRKGALGDSPYTETKEGDKYFKSPVFMMRASVNGAKADF